GILVFFFFQAEDGIRDFHVTGVQTCALPICRQRGEHVGNRGGLTGHRGRRPRVQQRVAHLPCHHRHPAHLGTVLSGQLSHERASSEERRVGKECRSRGAPSH